MLNLVIFIKRGQRSHITKKKISLKANLYNLSIRQLNLYIYNLTNKLHEFCSVGPYHYSLRNTYIFDQLIKSFLCCREDIRILGSEVRCESSHHGGYQGSRLVCQAGKDLGNRLKSAKINLPNASERTSIN